MFTIAEISLLIEALGQMELEYGGGRPEMAELLERLLADRDRMRRERDEA